MTDFIAVLSDESETNPFQGVFSSWQGIGGIVLIVVGLLMVYFGVKVLMGYSFFPGSGGGIKEDNFIKGTAKALQKKKTTMPSPNGGNDIVFAEWKIGYEVDGVKYTQIIPDRGYSKGDMLKIRYNPENPEIYYLDDKVSSYADSDASDRGISPAGIVILALAVMIAALGVVLIL